MKRLSTLLLVFCMLFALTACSNDNTGATFTTDTTGEENASQEEQRTEDLAIPLGDTGATVVIPDEMEFEAYESVQNDFFGGGSSGDWCIIANTEPKSDYPDSTLADYAGLSAEANDGIVAQDANGDYYFTYVNEVDGDVYKLYTAVREGANEYYRISFYCFDDTWEYYSDKFAEWAATIEVE